MLRVRNSILYTKAGGGDEDVPSRRAQKETAPGGDVGDDDGENQDTASMRSRATRASSASWAGTAMRLTTLPSARFSRVHARCWGSMRCMVEHMHTVGAMNCTTLPSGFISSARRLTRFSSVPTSQRVPGAPAWMVLMMYSVDPT